MSSLRNAVKRITHKERSQPQARSHLGILEKKKDYRVRARDYHNKEDRIRSLREKAAMRNPDEFYFGMNRSEVKDGKHRKTVEARQKELEGTIGADAVRIMKSQDLSYVRMQRQQDARKIEKLQASLHFLGDTGQGGNSVEDDRGRGGTNKNKKGRQHTVFVDSTSKAKDFDVASHFNTLPELAGRTFNRPRVSEMRATAGGKGYDDEKDWSEEEYTPTEKELAKQAKLAKRMAKKVARARSAAYGELEARGKRIEAIEKAEAHLVTEKLVSGKGRKRKLKAAEDGRPAQYKWRRKRAK